MMEIDSDTCTCQTCCEHFSSQKRRPVPCPGCDYVACLSCVEKYLCGTTDGVSRCMSCQQPWGRNHLAAHTTHAFLKRLREHEARVLLTQERSRLPEAQDVLDARQRIDELRRDLEAKTKRVNDTQMAYEAAKEEKRVCQELLEQTKREANIARLVGAQDPAPFRWVTVCPAEGCRGFIRAPDDGSPLSTCTVCSSLVCTRCNCLTGTEGKEHQCDPQIRLSVETLRQETRPCPSCRSLIHKIEGCEQMFCTACHTPFSWDTLEMLLPNTPLHNPHYLAWCQQTQQQKSTRAAPSDQVCGDGLAVPWLSLQHLHESVDNAKHCLPPVAGSVILAYAECLQQIAREYLARYPEMQRQAETSMAKLRLKYLQNQITEAEWLSKVRRIMLRDERVTERHALLNTFVYAGHDFLERVLYEREYTVRWEAVLGMVKLAQWVNQESLCMFEGTPMKPTLVARDKSLDVATTEEPYRSHGDLFEAAICHEAMHDKSLQKLFDCDGTFLPQSHHHTSGGKNQNRACPPHSTSTSQVRHDHNMILRAQRHPHLGVLAVYADFA